MKLSYFLEIVLQQSYVYACFFTAMGLSCLSEKTVKNHDWMELSWANNVHTTGSSSETHLAHGFAIENTYFLRK